MLTLEKLKIILSNLITAPHINNENYKSAYINGVLDLFNKIKDILEREVRSDGN